MFRRGVWCIWQRNFLYFRYTLLASILWVIGEPLIFLYAIGYGLGNYVGEIQGISYAKFFFPGFMLASAMLVAYFETTYSSYTKLTHQRVFQSMLLTPIMPKDIGYGEIFWAASKGFLSALGVAAASGFHGLIDTWLIVPALLVSFAIAWIFAAFGLLMSTYARSYDWFIYAQTGIIMPIYFFSGTYFPLENLPLIAQKIAWLSPLTHGVSSARMILASEFDWLLGVHVVVVVAFAVWLTQFAVRRLEGKLIL